MKRKGIETNGTRSNPLRNGVALLLLFVMPALSSCGDEPGTEIPIYEEEEEEEVLSFNIDTKAGLGVDGKEIQDCRTYIFRKGPDDDQYYMTHILNFDDEDSQTLTVPKNQLTEAYRYRFLSILRVDSEKYEGDFWAFYAEQFTDPEYRWLYAGEPEGQTWGKDLMINTGQFYTSCPDENLIYFDMKEKDGASLMTEKKVEMTLISLFGRLAVDMFKTSDGSIHSPVATSDGKPIFSLLTGYVPDYAVLQATSKLGLKDELKWNAYESETYGTYNYKRFVTKETYDNNVPGDVRIHFHLTAPADDYSLRIKYIITHFRTNYPIYLSFPKQSAQLSILPATTTVLKMAIAGDSIFDMVLVGSVLEIGGLNAEWEDN